MDEWRDWIEIGVGLGGGLAVFLFGLKELTDALKAAAGARLKTLLAKVTRTPILGAVTGALVTAILQSSSVTTVLVVGFISAGVMNLSQSVGVIMGANVGTTITAQIIAFKVTKAAMAMIAVGFLVRSVVPRDGWRQVGSLLFGLGLVFLGMDLMGNATNPLRDSEAFMGFMREAHSPLAAIVIAAIFTALVQSSSATTGIVILLAQQGFITLETGIALALGSNVGTCATAILAAIGKPREAVQAALVHVLFNVGGVLIWVWFVPQFADVVRALSPMALTLPEPERLAAETPRQIANAHTIFNVVNTLVFIWFARPFAWIVTKLVPIPPPEKTDRLLPAELDPAFLATPALAIERVRSEVARAAFVIAGLVDELAPLRRGADVGDRSERRAELRQRVADLRAFDQSILDIVRRISASPLSERESTRLWHLVEAMDHLDATVDSLNVDLAEIARRWEENQVVPSEATADGLRALHERIVDVAHRVARSIAAEDHADAARIVEERREVKGLVSSMQRHLASRLVADAPNRATTYRLEMELLDALRRIHSSLRRAAKAWADAAPEDASGEASEVSDQIESDDATGDSPPDDGGGAASSAVTPRSPAPRPESSA